MHQAIAVLFHLNRSPEAIGAALVRRIAADTLSSDEASPHGVARLCFVLGHLALKLLVYSEVQGAVKESCLGGSLSVRNYPEILAGHA